jgi:hypothetical protein
LTKFYFNEEPRQVYYVQWEGTGFISVRFAYNYRTEQTVLEDERDEVYVDEREKQRMAHRLRTEILGRIDSIIEKSADRDSAIFVSPL